MRDGAAERLSGGRQQQEILSAKGCISYFEVGSPRGRVSPLQRSSSIELSSSDEELKSTRYKFNGEDIKRARVRVFDTSEDPHPSAGRRPLLPLTEAQERASHSEAP